MAGGGARGYEHLRCGRVQFGGSHLQVWLLVLFLARSEEEMSGSDWAGKQICREATWVRADRAERDDVKVGKTRGPGSVSGFINGFWRTTGG